VTAADLSPDQDAESESFDTRVDSRRILDNAHDAFVSMDAGGFVTDWNPQAERTFGWSREQAIGSVLADMIIPEHYRKAHWDGLQRFISTGQGPLLDKRIEIEARHLEGHFFPIELTISAIRSADRWSFHAFLHDITERKQAQRLVAAQHAVATALSTAKSSQDAISKFLPALGQAMEWAMCSYWTSVGEELRCVEVWHAPDVDLEEFERVTTELVLKPGDGLVGRVWGKRECDWVDDVASDDRFVRAAQALSAGLHAAFALPVMSGTRVVGVIEFFSSDIRRPEAALIEMMQAISAPIGGLLASLDERAELLRKLGLLARTDELTGLANRRSWDEQLHRELARAARNGSPLSVALLDLDHFKTFNDEHGHQAGDALLRDLAGAWTACLRATDVIARYGGEEFALAFPAWPPEAALRAIERLRNAAAAQGQTCSAGLVQWDGHESAESLVGRADAALYAAKGAGRDRTVSG